MTSATRNSCTPAPTSPPACTPRALVEGKDYTYKILKETTDNVDSAQSVALHDAGTYVVYVIGQGKYAGEKEVIDINVASSTSTPATSPSTT